MRINECIIKISHNYHDPMKHAHNLLVDNIIPQAFQLDLVPRRFGHQK